MTQSPEYAAGSVATETPAADDGPFLQKTAFSLGGSAVKVWVLLLAALIMLAAAILLVLKKRGHKPDPDQDPDNGLAGQSLSGSKTRHNYHVPSTVISPA